MFVLSLIIILLAEQEKVAGEKQKLYCVSPFSCLSKHNLNVSIYSLRNNTIKDR